MTRDEFHGRWAGRAASLLHADPTFADPTVATRYAAARGRLIRAGAATDRDGPLSRAVRQAATFDPAPWLARAESLASACDEGRPAGELAPQAEGLLSALDDAELVAALAEVCGPARGDAEPLAACREWLRHNPDRLFPAEPLIRETVRCLDPELASRELALWASADNFLLLADALDEAGALTGPRALGDIPRGDWDGFPAAELALAAAVPAGGVFVRRWRSPDGRHRAVFAASPGMPRLRLNIDRGDDPAADLAGVAVWLAGEVAVIDAEGNAPFAADSLLAARQAGRAFTLAVGTAQNYWLGE